MKFFFTALILLLISFSAVNAQTLADLSVQITHPAPMTRFDYSTDTIAITYTIKNNGPDALDFIADTLVSAGLYSSIDSIFESPATQRIIYMYDPKSRFLLGLNEELIFRTETRMVRDLFSVFVHPRQAGDEPIIYRDNVRAGLFVLFVKLVGFGLGESGGYWEESMSYRDPSDSNNTGYVVVEFDRVNNIEETNNCTASLQLYPNPAGSGSVNFNYDFTGKGAATVRIADATGRVVLTKNIQGTGMRTINMDISMLRSGLYIMEVTAGDHRAVSKFTVGY